MSETGKIILGDKSATVTYTCNYQVYEICEANVIGRILLSGLYVGGTLVLEEANLRHVILMITEVAVGKTARCKAIIKK